MSQSKPTLHTSLSPSLLHLYDVSSSIVVIIDVLRATSTIATALYNGAKNIIPVDSVAECIRIGKQIEGITAGERDGQIAEGLQHGNSPLEYTREFIENKERKLKQMTLWIAAIDSCFHFPSPRVCKPGAYDVVGGLTVSR